MELTICLAQMHIELGNTEKNLNKAQQFIAEAKNHGAHVILFPELWSSGYDLRNCEQHALRNSDVLNELAHQARDCHLFIGGSYITAENGSFYNTFVLLDPNGHVISRYHKIHLFNPLHENRYFSRGNLRSTAYLPDLLSGLAICYDLRFPELFRSYLQDNVAAYLLVAQWPAERIAHWETLLRARAIENLAFVIACNATGITGKAHNGGSSLILNPWGETLAQGNQEEALVTTTLNTKDVAERRTTFSALDDRRLDLYATWF